ncbi:MAG: hypothetical protein KGQ40_07450, partial [Rhodospirillales bacterium]|nr:hypothetical protein [Rhodospirillales bacterium]
MLRAVLAVCVVLGLAGVWIAAAIGDAQRAENEALTRTALSARAAAEATHTLFQRFADLTGSFSAADLAPASRIATTTRLLRVQSALRSATAVFVADAAGRVLAASSPLPGGSLNVSDADWFQRGLLAPPTAVSVARVEASWLRPGPSVVVTQPILDAAGQPIGISGALLSIGDLVVSARPHWMPAPLSIRLEREDGVEILAAPDGNAGAAGPAPALPPWDERVFLALASITGTAPALIVSEPVAGSDVVAVASLPSRVALHAAWSASRDRLARLGIALVCVLLLVLLLDMVSRRHGRASRDAARQPHRFGVDWSFTTDMRGHLASVAGFAPEAVRKGIGRPLAAVLASETPATAIQSLESALGAKTVAEGIELRFGEAGRTDHVQHVWLRPMPDGRWSGTGRNVTETAAARARADEADRAAHEARERLDRATQERDRVLSAVGHDVRTPMNSILGICSLLLEGGLEDDQRAWVTRMSASCEALLAMLNGLLEIASNDAGTAELQLCEVDIADLVREVSDILTPQANDRGLELNLRIDEMLVGLWMADPTRLRQVLFNLGGNAIKYTGSGRVELRASVLSNAEGQTSIRVTVTDSGPGIAAE